MHSLEAILLAAPLSYWACPPRPDGDLMIHDAILNLKPLSYWTLRVVIRPPQVPPTTNKPPSK